MVQAAPFVSAVRAALASPSRKANADMMVLLRALATCEPAVAAPLAPLLKRLLPSLLRLADDQNTVEAGYAGLKVRPEISGLRWTRTTHVGVCVRVCACVCLCVPAYVPAIIRTHSSR